MPSERTSRKLRKSLLQLLVGSRRISLVRSREMSGSLPLAWVAKVVTSMHSATKTSMRLAAKRLMAAKVC